MANNLKNVIIDYDILSTAIQFYANKKGLTRIEVPWLVEEQYSLATSPTADRGIAYVTDGGQHLVCSAEQGFIQLMHEGRLKPEVLYFSISPCFRDEIEDQFHSKTFMKLELFAYTTKSESIAIKHMKYFCDIAYELFNDYLEIHCIPVATDHGFDILDHSGLELGSYGVRNLYGNYCVYGTGLALPRASIAKRKRNGLS